MSLLQLRESLESLIDCYNIGQQEPRTPEQFLQKEKKVDLSLLLRTIEERDPKKSSPLEQQEVSS